MEDFFDYTDCPVCGTRDSVCIDTEENWYICDKCGFEGDKITYDQACDSRRKHPN